MKELNHWATEFVSLSFQFFMPTEKQLDFIVVRFLYKTSMT